MIMNIPVRQRKIPVGIKGKTEPKPVFYDEIQWSPDFLNSEQCSLSRNPECASCSRDKITDNIFSG